jgi:dienelactone hydrolase
MHYNEHVFPHAVQDVFLRRIRELADDYDQRIAKLRTRRDAERLCSASRRKLRRIFGPLPKRSPLNVQKTGTLNRMDHTVEKLIFESRPGYFVTANLYLPKGDGPFPAVLEPCGHSANGKARLEYQTFGRVFARKGFVALVFDPVSQGERSNQYGDACEGGSCREHNMAGNQMTLVGEFFGTWRLWDGIRALDLLMSRPEVDKTRVGVTGCSGGGTMTVYLTAVDNRFAFAAPDCFVTDYLSNLENELPADAEQMPPGMLAQGMDMADFIIAHAPRPTILLSEEHDYFDNRGTRRTFGRLQKVYRLLGAPDAIQLYVGQNPHSLEREAREACYGFFAQCAGVAVSAKEPPDWPEKDETLYAAPDGDVLKLPGARRSFDFIAETARDLAKRRSRIPASRLPSLVSNLLNLPSRNRPPHFRTLRAVDEAALAPSRFRRLWLYGLETEPHHDGVTAVLLHLDPLPGASGSTNRAHPSPSREVIVYIPHTSTREDLLEKKIPSGDRENGFFAIEARGIGRMSALTCGSRTFFEPYGVDYFYASHGQMLGVSYVGRRIHDVLAALDLVEAHGARRVHLVGRGLGAILAAFAGTLHPLVKRITLRNALLSYHELTQTDVYDWPASMLPWEVLTHFDLPDIYRSLRRKHLSIEKPWDARMKSWTKPRLRGHAKSLGLAEAIFSSK